MSKCVVCKNKSSTHFNISFKKVCVCQSCANAITKQNVTDMCNGKQLITCKGKTKYQVEFREVL